MSKNTGGVLLCFAILCFILTAGFTNTSNPIVIIFPVTGFILLTISIVLMATQGFKDSQAKNTKVNLREKVREVRLDLDNIESYYTDLDDDEWKVRKKAVLALGQIADQRALDALIKALKDEKWEVRNEAIHMLGRIGDQKTLDPIISMLDDSNWRIRASAASVLGIFGNNEPVDSLITVLDIDDDLIVKKHTIIALSNIGDPIAIEALEKAYEDPKNKNIRDKIQSAIKKLKKIAISENQS